MRPYIDWRNKSAELYRSYIMPLKLWNFPNSEKLMKASTSRPDIVAEIRSRYDKMDSTIFIVENPDN